MLTFILSHAKYESFLYVPLNVENTEKKDFIGTKNRIRMINIDLVVDKLLAKARNYNSPKDHKKWLINQ